MSSFVIVAAGEEEKIGSFSTDMYVVGPVNPLPPLERLPLLEERFPGPRFEFCICKLPDCNITFLYLINLNASG